MEDSIFATSSSASSNYINNRLWKTVGESRPICPGVTATPAPGHSCEFKGDSCEGETYFESLLATRRARANKIVNGAVSYENIEVLRVTSVGRVVAFTVLKIWNFLRGTVSPRTARCFAMQTDDCSGATRKQLARKVIHPPSSLLLSSLSR